MTEAQATRDIIDFLKRHLSGVVWKHNDMRTAGIPDLSVTVSGATWWFEVKFIPNWSDRSKTTRLFPRLQLESMCKLERAGLRARYLLVIETSLYGQRRLSIVIPQEIKRKLDGKIHLFFSPAAHHSADWKADLAQLIHSILKKSMMSRIALD